MINFRKYRNKYIKQLLLNEDIEIDDQTAIDAILHCDSRLSLDLLKKCPTVYMKTSTNFSSLHAAANRGSMKIMRYLVERYISEGGMMPINEKDSKGNTPLHLAIWSKHEKVVRFLLENGASLLIKNNMDIYPHQINTTSEITQILTEWQDLPT